MIDFPRYLHRPTGIFDPLVPFLLWCLAASSVFDDPAAPLLLFVPNQPKRSDDAASVFAEPSDTSDATAAATDWCVCEFIAVIQKSWFGRLDVWTIGAWYI